MLPTTQKICLLADADIHLSVDENQRICGRTAIAVWTYSHSSVDVQPQPCGRTAMETLIFNALQHTKPNIDIHVLQRVHPATDINPWLLEAT